MLVMNVSHDTTSEDYASASGSACYWKLLQEAFLHFTNNDNHHQQQAFTVDLASVRNCTKILVRRFYHLS